MSHSQLEAVGNGALGTDWMGSRRAAGPGTCGAGRSCLRRRNPPRILTKKLPRRPPQPRHHRPQRPGNSDQPTVAPPPAAHLLITTARTSLWRHLSRAGTTIHRTRAHNVTSTVNNGRRIVSESQSPWPRLPVCPKRAAVRPRPGSAS